MNVVLALLSAFCAGTSDFLGGLGARRAPALVITAGSQAVGFVVACAIAVAAGGDPTGTDLLWGALGGLGGATGVLSIYAGYARARVAIAAPVAGVGTAAIPALFDVVTGDELSATAGAGMVLGLAAIAMVSSGRTDTAGSATASLLYGLGGAAGLGFLLLCLGQTSEDGGVWTVAPTRLLGFVFMAGVIAVTGTPHRPPRPALPFIVGVGILGTGANAMFVAATQLGPVATAAVLVSLFPAVTVLWARIVFQERLRGVQVAGLALAVTSVALIAGA